MLTLGQTTRKMTLQKKIALCLIFCAISFFINNSIEMMVDIDLPSLHKSLFIAALYLLPPLAFVGLVFEKK